MMIGDIWTEQRGEEQKTIAYTATQVTALLSWRKLEISEDSHKI